MVGLVYSILLLTFTSVAKAALPLIGQPEIASVDNFFQYGSIPDFAHGATCTSAQSGVWSSPNVWSCGRMPTTDDVVLIASSHTINYNVDNSIASNHRIDRIAIDGSLVFDTSADRALYVRTVFVKKAGEFLIGSSSQPVAWQRNVEIVFLSDQEPVDARPAGSEWANGLVCLGRCAFYGRPVQPYLRLHDEIAQATGVAPLSLNGLSSSQWRAGDEVFIPDTRSLSTADRAAGAFDFVNGGHLERLVIDTIDLTAETVTFVAPGVQHAHPGCTDGYGNWDLDAGGNKVMVPHVVNLERNIVFRSEAALPYEKRAHAIFASEVLADIFYAKFKDMGRTKGWEMPSAATNPIGRYAVHFHHAIGRAPSGARLYVHHCVGNVIEDALKWGVAVHNTHYSLFERNVVLGAGGAGILTEDGNEYGNVFGHNYVAVVYGGDWAANTAPAKVGIATEGSGYWLHGPFSDWTGNIATGILTQNVAYTSIAPVPRQPGTLNGTQGSGFTVFCAKAQKFAGTNKKYVPNVAGSFDINDWVLADPYIWGGHWFYGDNEAYGVVAQAITWWYLGTSDGDLQEPGGSYPGNKETIISDLRAWNVYNSALYPYHSQTLTLHNITLRSPTGGRYGLRVQDYLSANLTLLGCDFSGFEKCVGVPILGSLPCHSGTWNESCDAADTQFLVQDSFFHCVAGAELHVHLSNFRRPWYVAPHRVVFANNRFDKFVTLYGGSHWTHVNMRHGCGQNTNYLSPFDVYFVDHMGESGNDFKAFFHEQRPDWVWDLALNNTCCNGGTCSSPTIGSPVAGLTTAQLWAQYGYAYAGSVAPCDESTVNITGRVQGVGQVPLPTCTITAQQRATFWTYGEPPPQITLPPMTSSTSTSTVFTTSAAGQTTSSSVSSVSTGGSSSASTNGNTGVSTSTGIGGGDTTQPSASEPYSSSSTTPTPLQSNSMTKNGIDMNEDDDGSEDVDGDATIPLLIGIAVTCAVLLLCAVGIACVLYRRRERSHEAVYAMQTVRGSYARTSRSSRRPRGGRGSRPSSGVHRPSSGIHTLSRSSASSGHTLMARQAHGGTNTRPASGTHEALKRSLPSPPAHMSPFGYVEASRAAPIYTELPSSAMQGNGNGYGNANDRAPLVYVALPPE